VRVGLIIYGSLDLVSGGFLYDRLVVRQLRAAGVEVQVVALPWRRWGGALAENLQPWPAALEGCQVVLQDQLIHPAVFARNARLRRPIIALVHNLSCAPGVVSLPAVVERRYFETVDGAVAVCHDTLARVRALAPGLPGVVARAGRDHLPPPGRRPEGHGPLRLLFVGTVMPHKGLHRLLEALSPLPPDWTLDVVGSLTADPAYAARLRATAPASVRWHGQLDGEALWRAFGHSDLFVLPSDREAYSVACLEALGFGLPVLVTDRGGMREMISGDEGLVLPPDQPAAWTGAIAHLMMDRTRLAAMSAAARARFEAHGTWGQTAAAIAGFLRGFLAGSRPDLH
jgi:glycosyltransferase involved in cell wall biosynthesis